MKTELNKDIERAGELLKKGDLVAIPTETVYGLAAVYNQVNAIQNIFRVKRRPSHDPLILHAKSIDQIREFIVREFPEKALELAEKYWPGPLTLVLPKKKTISDEITSGLDTVAVRIPNHPLLIELLQKIDKPLAAPSANPFGYISPTTANHVYDQLNGKIPMILDGGPTTVGLESTILRLDNNNMTVLRAGGIPIEELKVFDPDLKINTSSSRPSAPGMLDKHYSPKKNLFYLDEIDMDKVDKSKTGLICFSEFKETFPVENQILLSPENDLKIAARNLYSAMRQMDQSQFEIILTERFPERELGVAINDRLRRAVSRI